jgi:Gpi18-like mannosyltransferase
MSLSQKKESWMLIIGVGFILKLFLFPVRLGDYNTYLEPWINFIKQNGYLSALQYDFYNYAPSYIYFLIGIAKTGLNPLFSIKLLSVVFEFVLAFFLGKIVYLKYKDPLVIWVALAVIPLVPTIILNGAFWGQCDSIYSTFVVASIYFSLTRKQFLSCLFLGIAFAFKFQAVFILPFFFVMMLRGNIKWYYFLLIPLIYFISVLPTWFYGRSLTDLLLIYFRQSDYFEMLTVFLPNIYAWISNDYFELVKPIGIAFTFVFTLFFGIWLSNRKYEFTFDNWIELAFLSVIIVPFICLVCTNDICI